MIRNCIYFLIAISSGLFIASIVIYQTAPVENLRQVIAYTPPGKSSTREVGLAKADNLTLADMPMELIWAVIASEDNEFWRHDGIRPRRIYDNIIGYFDGTYPILKGGSTITQQLAKNIFTGSQRSLYRKYVEFIYAIKLEQTFTKEEIFTLYVNIVQLGPELYGFKDAAHMYFNKPVSRLTYGESVALVMMLPSPMTYYPALQSDMLDPRFRIRMIYLVNKMLNYYQVFVPFGQLSRYEKEHIFSYYMQQKGRQVCLSQLTYDKRSGWIENIIAQFEKEHYAPQE
ncbi:MAG: biosynthetic peptidoglycan transglycosylase [Rickettsiales bacterium]|nr:biosynthetic peptidoglycan transglycosylase [Rickettsiales bacterium]